MGTVSGVTADNVTTSAGDITYGDDTFYHNLYAKYTLNGESKIVDVTSILDFNCSWTIDDTSYLKQNTVNKKDVEVVAVGDNKNATVKLGTGAGFVAKQIRFNTKKLDSSVQMTVEGTDIAIDRIGEFYSSSPTSSPTKVTATLKANGTTRLKDKTYTYTFSSASAGTENGYIVQSYAVDGFSDSTLKAKISTSDYASKLDITSSSFNRSGTSSDFSTVLNVNCSLYNFSATNSNDVTVTLNRYAITYSTEYQDLAGDKDKITPTVSSSIKNYYFADENVNVNSGKSDSLTYSTGGYTFNGFVMDTAFTSDFLSSANLNENYMVSRGSYDKTYANHLAIKDYTSDQDGYGERENYFYRNHLVIIKKVKAGTKITFNSFTYNNQSIRFGVILSDEVSVTRSTLSSDNYSYDSGWLSSTGQAKRYDKGIANEYVVSGGKGIYTVDGYMYKERNYSNAKTKFDYVYVAINVMYGTSNVTKLDGAELITALATGGYISIDGVYQENVYTSDAEINEQSLAGSWYVAQGTYGHIGSNEKMRIVITRPIKEGTVISWSSNTISAWSSLGRTYKFGIIASKTPERGSSYVQNTDYTDSGWLTATSGSYTVPSTLGSYAYIIINVMVNTSTTTITDTTGLITGTAGTDVTSRIGEDINEPATVFSLFSFNGYFKANDTATSDLAFSMPAQNIYLESTFKARYYTVTYNYNDGSGTATTKTVRYGETFTTDVIPTKSNYIFCGWTVSTGNSATRAQWLETVSSGKDGVNTGSTKTVWSDVLSSSVICNNKWTGNVTFKSLADAEGQSVILYAQWASNKSTNTDVSSGYINNSTGLNLNGTNYNVWSASQSTSNNISVMTELMTNLYGNFTKTLKIYQEACNAYTDAPTYFANSRWNTAILGFFRFVTSGSDMSTYYKVGSKTANYWTCYSVVRQDNHYFTGAEITNGDGKMIGTSIASSSISNASFFNGTMTGLRNSSYNAFYEACRRSYVTYVITGVNVGSKGGYVTVKMTIQSADTVKYPTAYSLTYTISGLDEFPLDICVFGDRANFVILQDTLTKNSLNSTYMSYSNSGWDHDIYIQNYSHYSPNVTFSTDLTTKEAYTFEFKQTMLNGSSVYNWSGDCAKTPLIVLYDTSNPSKYTFAREDWISYVSTEADNVTPTFKGLKFMDITASTNFTTNETFLNRLKSSTVRVTIQKSNSFIHVKWEIGVGSGESTGAYNQDWYLYYVSTSTGDALGANVGSTDNSTSIGIMLVCESSSFEITKPIYPISATDNIYYESLKFNYGAGGWADNNIVDNSYFSYFPSQDGSTNSGTATISAGTNRRFYFYMRANGASAGISGQTIAWDTPLPIVFYGNLNSSNQNIRIYRFDDLTFGAGNHAYLSGSGSYSGWDNTYTYSASPNYSISDNYYSSVVANILQHGMCIIDLDVASGGTSVTLTRYISNSYASVGWWGLTSASTDGLRIQTVSNVHSDVANSSLKLGLAMTCEYSNYSIIRGIPTTY